LNEISQKTTVNNLKSITIMAQQLKVTPLHDRVIVKPAPAEEKTAGGIIIPDTAKEKPQRGTVVAAGPGKKDEPVTVKVGDTVLYGKYSGTEIQVEGGEYLIMRESDILAIV
jgi:chaperonin GroES